METKLNLDIKRLKPKPVNEWDKELKNSITKREKIDDKLSNLGYDFSFL